MGPTTAMHAAALAALLALHMQSGSAQPTAVLNAAAVAIDGAVNITWSPPASGTVASYRSECAFPLFT